MTNTAGKTYYLVQTLIDINSGDIPTITVKDSYLPSDLTFLSVFDHVHPIGISPGYSATGKLVALAVADDKNCRIIEFTQPKRSRGDLASKKNDSDVVGQKILEEKVLCRPIGDLYAFDIGPLSLSLFWDIKLRIVGGVDIQSGYSAVGRKPLQAIKDAVGDTIRIMDENVIAVFRNPIYDEEDRNRHTDLAMRAWVSRFLATYASGEQTFSKVPRINTKKHNMETLNMIAKVATDATRLDQKKPTIKKHQITQSINPRTGKVQVVSLQYKDKVRPEQTVRMDVRTNGQNIVVSGSVGGVTGKIGNLTSRRDMDKDDVIMTLTSIGRDDPTTAEAQRAATVLRILQGSEQLLSDTPWIQNIWFPATDGIDALWPDLKDWPTTYSSDSFQHNGNLVRHTQTLNSSQQQAVNTMMSLDNQDRITLIQGPPGTGKTSVIASYVLFATALDFRGIWLVAASNVAVKNIAEKLKSVGFEKWKIIVSKDFHHEWHEHLYTDLQPYFIRSDEIATSASQIKGCQVILSTLSMLSNGQIHKITRYVPVTTLIVDEASQIEVGQYISVFVGFPTLRKVCFIGDDKQLPPYGQEDLQDLQSIFELPHLRKNCLFLDTQYRMPPQIGAIISEAVYDSQLQSNPLHPIKDKVLACRFIDIPDGKEKKRETSYMNQAECDAVLILAEKIQDLGLNYRIITPYEEQRNAIESGMKANGLHWGDKCFNVDSFQGNEDDYIIISLVRSQKLGFLKDLRRTNVMLTRCKKGMFIVTSKEFMAGKGATSLVGKMLEKTGPEAWLTMKEVEKGSFVNAKRH